MDHIVVDVEIIKDPLTVPNGWRATDQLGVSVAVTYGFGSDRFRVYGPNDLDSLRERVLRADRVTTFNGWNFDFPVIWGVSADGWWKDMASRNPAAHRLFETSDDLLRRAWISQGLNPDEFIATTHGGFGLENFGRGTLNRGKIGKGDKIPQMFADGNWAGVVTYCIDDVALTRDLVRIADRDGAITAIRSGNRVVRCEMGPWAHTEPLLKP